MPADPHEASFPLACLDARQLTAALGRGELRAVEVVQTLFDRVGAIDNPESAIALRSVIAPSARALDEAAESDARRAAGKAIGPLEGVPVFVKDNIDVLGQPSSAGSTALSGRPVRADAPLVSNLRRAGCIVLGTTNLSEWANIRSAHSTSGWSALGGLCGNPWSLSRSAGGSSSGSAAAVAAGFAPISVGTETDGSIVCPASLCGVVGLKPTVGAVTRSGVIPISTSQDSVGPMGRSVADVALTFEALAARTGVLAAVQAGVDGVRIGVARGWTTNHDATDAAFERTLDAVKHAGVLLVDREPPSPDEQLREDELIVLLCELVDGIDAYLLGRDGPGPRSFAEVVEFQAEHAEVELVHFGQDQFERALAFGGSTYEQYAPARQRNLAWTLETCLGPTFEDLDVLVSPAFGPAWKSDLILGDPEPGSSCCRPAAIAGWPIASLPMAIVDGLPVGLALTGRPGSEPAILAVAAAFERALGLVEDGALEPAWAVVARG